MTLPDSLPIRPFPSQKAWSAWLAKQHAKSKGVWLKLAKAGTGIPTVTYAEALDVALCWGWIDSQKRGFDAKYWLQRFTPRGAKSIWSKINTGHVARLSKAGLMRAPGLKAVEAAKQDGRWKAAYHGQGKAPVPADLKAALAKNKKAAEFFETLKGAQRYAILFRLHTAKKPETRARKIAAYVKMLANREKLYPVI